jgi:RNA polymerase sigma factor (sigma-70 family)
VDDITLDQAIPVVRNLAGRKAGAFVRGRRLALDEREDIESRLVLAFIARWPKFDSERASVQTFASRLMDHELISILRYRLAEARQLREPPALDDGPRSASIHQFRLDLESALAQLPEVVRQTASALASFSAVDAAVAVGCSRQTISRRKQKIRKAFISAGIGPDYFVAGGAR